MEDNVSDVINNFKKIITDNLSKDKNQENKKEKDDANQSSSFNVSPDMLNVLMSSLNNSSNNKSNGQEKEKEKEKENNNLDVETLLKIKSIIENFNQKDDARSNLLYSLKPYLRESRQKKIEQYVNLFKISKVTNLFRNEK